MNSNIEHKSFLFSVRIVKLARYLQEEKKIYTKIKGKNFKQEWMSRFNEVKYQYAIQEYEKALEIIEQLKPIGKYYVLATESYKQRCLYHLKKEYKIFSILLTIIFAYIFFYIKRGCRILQI